MDWVLVIFFIWGAHQFSVTVPVATKALCLQAQKQAETDLIDSASDPRTGYKPPTVMTCLQVRQTK